MKGTMLVIDVNGASKGEPIGKEAADTSCMLQKMKRGIGGGYIEKVPGFDYIMIDNVTHHCVALCDEDGKRKEMPVNKRATILWDAALKMRGHPGLIVAATGQIADVLVGPIVVLYGDKEFMEAL